MVKENPEPNLFKAARRFVTDTLRTDVAILLCPMFKPDASIRFKWKCNMVANSSMSQVRKGPNHRYESICRDTYMGLNCCKYSDHDENRST